MEVSEAEPRLRQLLEQGRLDTMNPHPTFGWEAFKQFAYEPTRCAEEYLAVRIGVFDSTGSEQFHFECIRFFHINDEEKYYSHREKMTMLFFTPPTDELHTYKVTKGTWTTADLMKFFLEIESEQAFQAVMNLPKWECRLWHNERV